MAEFSSMDSDERAAESLEEQLDSLQIEKRKIQDEFGMQRAKLKEIYLQKEDEFKQQLVSQEEKFGEEIQKLQTELNDCQSQLTIARLQYQSTLQEAETEARQHREELSSLHHLLNESMEQNAQYANEIQHLKHLSSKLESELRTPVASTGVDMPQILSVPGTVFSSLARKVTNQITTQLSNSDGGFSGTSPTLSQFSDSDTLDDSMRKAQEDANVLRSLVVPLEEEIKALKDKLREMDAELRKYQCNNSAVSLLDEDDAKSVKVEKMLDLSDESSSNILDAAFAPENSDPSAKKSSLCSSSTVSMTPSTVTTTESLLEISPMSEKKSVASGDCELCSNYEAQLVNAQQKILDLEKHIITLERYKQELSKETAFRKDMEEKWNEKKEEYKEEVKTLQAKTEKAEETLKALRTEFTKAYKEVTREVDRLCHDREEAQRELNRLQEENHNLVGKFNKHSQQLQNEVINLPNNVADLQEVILRTQDELIAAKVAEEEANEKVMSLIAEVQILRDHNQNEEHARIELENVLVEIMTKLRKALIGKHSEPEKFLGERQIDVRREIKQFSSNVDKLIESKKHFEKMVSELRSRVTSLQTDLDNSEKVQKDFVLLSQSLQQELEKIRGAETEVRWEHDEDVMDCKKCRQPFSVTRRKVHCKHCGRVFCSSCLTCTVNSGPNNRSSKVCDVCHTLLVRDSAPYFSTVPPQGD